MATQYTSLLGLALPVQGELSGTWGDTVNNAITSLLDTAVAGTTTLSTDGDVTLTTTTGASNQARQSILLCSGARTALRTITAPAQSKIYTVINATTGGFSVKVVGAGPTTGVTIVAGESALIAWNGSDFIKVSNTGGSASFTNVTVSGTTTLSGLTASTALALDASKNVVSVTNTGTGNNVLATSPTLVTPALGTPSSATLTNATGLPISTGVSGLGTGIATALAVNVGTAGAPVINGGALGTPSSGTVTNLTGTASININGTVGATTATTGAFTTLAASGAVTLSGGTANGVAYLNGSKVLTTGSALTFDGTNLSTTGTSSGSRIIATSTLADGSTPHLDTSASAFGIVGGSSSMGYKATSQHIWNLSGTSEQMRLTSTGLGIGTSSPSVKLDVAGGAKLTGTVVTTTGSDAFSAGSGTGTSIRVNALFKGTDASGNARTSYIGTNIYGTDGSMEFGNNVAGLTMSIAPGGNVGIGTSSPQQKLQVSGGRIRMSSDNVNGGDIAVDSTGLAFSTLSTTQPIIFLRNNYATESMRIDSSGNVGIGTSSPGAKLDVHADAVFGIRSLRNTGNGGLSSSDTAGGIRLGTSNGSTGYVGAAIDIQAPSTWTAGTSQPSDMRFFTVPSGSTTLTERMRIDSSGNVGIGTSSPGAKLQVAGNTVTSNLAFGTATSSAGTLSSDTANSGSRIILWGSTSANTGLLELKTVPAAPITFATSNAERMRIDASGNLAVGTTTPVARLGVYGAGQTTAAMSTSSGLGSTLYVRDSDAAAGNGGAVMFGANQGAFAAIKGLLSDGANNTSGALAFSVRPATTDATLTEAMRISSTGNVGIGTSSPAAKLDVSASTGAVIRMTSSADGIGAGVTIGDLQFYGNDASVPGAGVKASISAVTNNALGDDADLIFKNSDGTTNNIERMRISYAGNVGIGTSSPVGNLDVAGTTPTLNIRDTQSKVSWAAGDIVATLDFYSNDTSGVGAQAVSRIRSVADAASAATSGALAFWTAAAGAAATEKLRIDSSGNVGIGTSLPTHKLTVAGTTRLDSGATNYVDIGGNLISSVTSDGARIRLAVSSAVNPTYSTTGDTNTGVFFPSADALGLSTGGSERLRIDSSGNLLVGTTSANNAPANGVQLWGSTAHTSSGGMIAVGHVSAAASGTYYQTFAYNGTIIGSITQSGTTAVLYNTTSDQRLKENIQDSDSASELIDSLQVRQFDWKADGSHQRYGFVAQELVTVAPEAVHQPADPEEMMAVDYSKLVPMLIKEVQALRARVAALESI